MWLSKTVLSSTGTRAAGIHPHDGECGGRGVPKEDEDRGGAGHLQEAGTGGGVSQCLDRGEVRDSEIPAAGDGQGEHGSTVGSVHLQRAAMDPIELAAEADGWRKDSHGDGIAKAGKRAKLGLEGLSGPESGAMSRRLDGDGRISILYTTKYPSAQCHIRPVTQFTTSTLVRWFSVNGLRNFDFLTASDVRGSVRSRAREQAVAAQTITSRSNQCQRKVEMSYSLQSRNVRFSVAGLRERDSLG